MSDEAKPEDPRAPRARLIDDGLLPNPDAVQMSMAGAHLPTVVDPRIEMLQRNLAELTELHMTTERNYQELWRKHVDLDRQNVRLQQLVGAIHREGLEYFGEHFDEAVAYALSG